MVHSVLNDKEKTKTLFKAQKSLLLMKRLISLKITYQRIPKVLSR